MQRFYFENLDKNDSSIIIKNPDLLNQLIKVLRAKNGDKFCFFNGINNINYFFEIKEVEKREIYLEKIGEQIVDNEIDFNLNIFQALPNKLEKLEYILQKGVEIGVSNFYFFRAERSQKLNLSENKIIRLKKIIIESVEQSGRSIIPEFIIEENINLELCNTGENIFFHTKDDNSITLKDLKLDYNKTINLFIGPEGGFDDKEIDLFEELNFKKVHLGPRILRTETTGIVSAFCIVQNKK